MSEKKYLTENSWYIYKPNYLTLTNEEYDKLWNEHPKEFSKVVVFGKEYDTPRWSMSYERDYKYSGVNHKGKDLPDNEAGVILRKIKQSIQDGSEFLYNQTLINWYQDGSHYIGKHSDNEKDLNEKAPIYSISIGETRIFRIRYKDNSKEYEDFELTNGSLFVMGGDFQKELTHEVPKTKKPLKSRINITFRSFI